MTDIHAIHPCPPNITINSSMVINVDQELIMGGADAYLFLSNSI